MNNYISEELENLEILANRMTDEANDLAEMANDLTRAAGREDEITQSSIFEIREVIPCILVGLFDLIMYASSLKENKLDEVIGHEKNVQQ